MGCLCTICQNCCTRLGFSCKNHDNDGEMTQINQNRVCTDMPCIGLFGVYCAILFFWIWIVAYEEGDPDRLIRGVNHAGKICGESDGVEHLPYAFWPVLTDYRFKVCTDDCNKATYTDYATNHITLPIGYQVPEVNGAPAVGADLLGYKSKPYLKRYCRPILDSLEGLVEGMDSNTEIAERAIGDIKTAMPLFGWTFMVAMIMSFLFILLMRFCVGVFVWGIILLILVSGYGLGYILYDWSKDDEDELEANEEKYRFWAAIFFWVATTIFFLIIIFARKRIKIAIEVIKSASRALADMPFMVLFPVPVIIIFAGFFFAWAYAAIYIFSAGETNDKDTPDGLHGTLEGETFAAENNMYTVGATYKVLDYDDTIKNSFAPHFFLLLWVTQIFIYFTFMVVAGAVADWYFTPRENGDKKRGMGEDELSRCAVTKSCWRSARYHLGSIIFAAAIIAIIQFIRAVVHYIERQLNPGDKAPNPIQKFLFRCLDCMLWCLECCLDKLNRNALVWVQVYGDAFCPSVCGSFMLIWANLFRVAVITFFSGIVTLLGKILIPVFSTAIMAMVLHYHDDYEDITSVWYPLIIIFIISLCVAQVFMTVYDTTIDTIFLCFLIDEKHNKSTGAMMADPNLREIVQKYEKQSTELADSKKRNKRDAKGGGDKAQESDVEIQV